MSDDICFALLRTTLYQLLHSTGFEASHGEPANVLTDIFGQYIQLLATSASTHAHLAGRTVASLWDIMDGLGDVQVTLDQLDEWLESEQGQFLTPAWSTRTDPNLVLKDVVTKGQVHHEIDDTLYEYDTMNQQYRLVCSDNNIDINVTEETQPAAATTTHPDYIPSHLPAFPLNDPEVDLSSDESALQTSYPTSLSSLLPSTDHTSSKKANDNPFTQLVSFDESSLASGNGLFLTLALPVQQKHKHQDEDNKEDLERAKKRRRAELDGSMESTIKNIVHQYKYQQHIQMDGNQRMFQHLTQNEAAPGKPLLGTRDSMLDEIVYRLAPPVALSRLDSPNLIMDTNTFGEDEEKPVTPAAEPTPSLNGSNHVSPRRLESPQPTVKVPMSIALLSSRGDTNPAKKDDPLPLVNKAATRPAKSHSSKPTLSSSHPPGTKVNTLSPSTPPPPQSTKSNVIIQATAQPKIHNMNTNKFKSAAVSNIPNTTIPVPPRPKTTTIINSIPSTPPQRLQSTKTSTIDVTQSIPQPRPQIAKTGTASLVQSTPQPVKKNTVNAIPSSVPVKKNSAVDTASIFNPALITALRPPPSTSLTTTTTTTTTTTPILKKKKKRTEDRPDPARLKVRFEDDPLHRPPRPPSIPPYMSTNEIRPPQPISTFFPRTAFPRSSPIPSGEYVKPPLEPWRPAITLQPPAYDATETVRCICQNPTVDYGSFMISCDICLVWFHGTCVGITEQMLVEEWVCSRCRH